LGIVSTPPEPNEIEVSIFGPGYGECCLIHFGGGWIVIDSCIDVESDRPAALRYLEAIGVNYAQLVKLIVASHWHDDHIRGLAALVKACEQATFCASSALNTKEFLSVLTAYDQNKGIHAGSGTTEIIATLRVLQGREPASHPLRALASTRLLQLDGAVTGHGHPVEVWALSPSSAQFDQFLREIGTPHTHNWHSTGASQSDFSKPFGYCHLGLHWKRRIAFWSRPRGDGRPEFRLVGNCGEPDQACGKRALLQDSSSRLTNGSSSSYLVDG
jgi:hypothetical protein